MRKKATLSESALQEHVVKLLFAYAREDICWWACPNGDYRNPIVGARLKRQGVRPGAADIMFVIDSQFFGLELKTEIGSMSVNQKEYMQNLTRAGGIYMVAFGLEQALAALINIKAFKPNIHVGIPQLTHIERKVAYGTKS